MWASNPWERNASYSSILTLTTVSLRGRRLITVMQPYQTVMSGRQIWSSTLPTVVLPWPNGELVHSLTSRGGRRMRFTMMTGVTRMMGTQTILVKRQTNALPGERQGVPVRRQPWLSRYYLGVLDAQCEERPTYSRCSEGGQEERSPSMAWFCRVVLIEAE